MKRSSELISALSFISKKEALRFHIPKGVSQKSVLESLDDICNYSKIRFRQVELTAGWWKKEGETLLVFYGEELLPAVLFKDLLGWSLYLPRYRDKIAIDEETAQKIVPLGYVFYPTLQGNVSFSKLIRLSLKQSSVIFRRYFILGLLSALLGLFTPFVYKTLFDDIVPNSDFSSLAMVILALVVIAITTFSFQFVRSLLMLRFEGEAQNRLNIAIWDRFLKLPATFFRQYAAGDLIQRSDMVDNIQKTLSVNTIGAIFGGFFALLYVIPMLYFSWQLTLIGLTSLLLSFIVTYFFLRYRVRIERSLLAVQADINLYLIQLVRGIAKIRVAGAEKRAFNHWLEKFITTQDLEFSIGKYENQVGIFSGAVSSFSLILIYGVVIYLLEYQVDPNFTVGTFMAFNAAFIPFTQSLYSVFSIAMSLIIVVPAWERAKLIFDTPEEEVKGNIDPPELKGGIELKNVSFTYPGSHLPILNNISLSIKPGEFVGIVGPSGSGKTTLLRMILGFETADKGEVLFDGYNIDHLKKDKLRQQFGVVLQTSAIIVGTVYENIVLNRAATLQQIQKAILLSSLDEVIDELPMGLDTLLPSGGGNLSGGQKQRILLARALVSEPKILILDEATSALDNIKQAHIQRNLDLLNITRVVVAHRLNTLVEANRIYVLNKSEIVESGSFNDLLVKNGLFTDLVNYQKL